MYNEGNNNNGNNNKQRTKTQLTVSSCYLSTFPFGVVMVTAGGGAGGSPARQGGCDDSASAAGGDVAQVRWSFSLWRMGYAAGRTEWRRGFLYEPPGAADPGSPSGQQKELL